MVRLNLTRMEVQELRVWAVFNKEKQEEVGLPWDIDQQKLCEKLNYAIGVDKNGERLISKCANCGRPIEIGSDYQWWHIKENYLFDKDDICKKAVDTFGLKSAGMPTKLGSSSGLSHEVSAEPSHSNDPDVAET